jgi:16S rRNA processing protein RimM
VAEAARPFVPARIEIGRVVKPHGLKGELVVSGVRLDPTEFLALRDVEAIGPDGARRALRVRATRPFMQSMLVEFEGVDDVDAARLLHGQVLEVDPGRLPPAGDGTVYLFQLLGLLVVTEQGEALGAVSDVLQTGATPILVVRGEPGKGGKARERMIPMSPDVLLEVDRGAGQITVRLLPGMEDL